MKNKLTPPVIVFLICTISLITLTLIKPKTPSCPKGQHTIIYPDKSYKCFKTPSPQRWAPFDPANQKRKT